MAAIVYPNNFDASKLTIGTLKVLDSGAKQAFVSYGGNKFTIQTAINMHLPFGLNVYDKTSPPEYSIDVSFRDYDTRPEVTEFLDTMKSLDEKMIQEGVKNSRAWFKMEPKQEVIKAFYSPCVKYSTDKDGNVKPYPPTMKFKIKQVNGEVETKFYNVDGTPYDNSLSLSESLPKGARITVLAQCTGVWLSAGKYGLSWRTKQVVIHSVPETIRNFAIKLPTGTAQTSIIVSKPVYETDVTETEEDENTEEIVDDVAFSTCVNTAVHANTPPSIVAAFMPAFDKQMENDTIEESEEVNMEPVPLPVRKPVIKKKVVSAPIKK